MFKLFLLLNPVYVTLFWAAVLNTVKPQGNEPKTFLGKFFAVAFLTFIAHLLYFIPIPQLYVYVDSIYFLTHLLVFPLYYVYVRLLCVDPKFSWKKHCKYLCVPFVLFLFYGVGILFMTKVEYIDFIYNTLINGEHMSGIFLYQKTIYFLIRLVFIIQGILYMTLSIITVNRNQENIVNFYSNTEDDSLRKIQWLNVTVSVTMTICVIMEVIGKESFTARDFFLLAPSGILSVMLFCIGWLGNRQRAVLLTDIEENNRIVATAEETERNAHTKKQNSHIKNRLEKLFIEKQIYLNKDLTIWELAEQLNTNRSYLSQIINKEYGQNFSAFVNSYRACHAQNLLQSNPEHSQAEIAEMSGFGSVKSWKRASKE
ncbi:MAG: helix-turn-helix domain-containing protein [Bacteroidetes bacterium]|nr:helix-turn-helix domain-containing protein [Bacteroidota bacterium]